MSADKAHPPTMTRLALVCGLLCVGAMAIADEEEMPDEAFLEYLGSWEASDEDWVMLSEMMAARLARQAEAAAKVEDTVETDDES